MHTAGGGGSVGNKIQWRFGMLPSWQPFAFIRAGSGGRVKSTWGDGVAQLNFGYEGGGSTARGMTASMPLAVLGCAVCLGAHGNAPFLAA